MAFYMETGKNAGLPMLGAIRNRMAGGIGRLRANRARRALYNETFVQLARLSDRDLADIGVSRANIRHVAQEESMKAVLK